MFRKVLSSKSLMRYDLFIMVSMAIAYGSLISRASLLTHTYVAFNQSPASLDESSTCSSTDSMDGFHGRSFGFDSQPNTSSSDSANEMFSKSHHASSINSSSKNDSDSTTDAIFMQSQQPPIVTFDEWTKEKLKIEEQKKQHSMHSGIADTNSATNSAEQNNYRAANELENSITNGNSNGFVHPQATQRNYASKDCGSKVLASNDGAENKNAVLNEKERDEYMRIPCALAKNKWLIIELCETVQPTAIELANFELFSSGPRNVQILVSERYPTNDWILIANITAESNREIQRFHVSVPGIYVKFVQVQLHSHYGNEHYCTLSIFRLLGISMVDEYEAEAEAAAIVPQALPTSDKSDANIDLNPGGTESQINFSRETCSDSEMCVRRTVKQQDHHVESKESNSKENIPPLNAVANEMGVIEDIKNVTNFAFMPNNKINRSLSKRFRSIISYCMKCSTHQLSLNIIFFCRAFFPFLSPHLNVSRRHVQKDLKKELVVVNHQRKRQSQNLRPNFDQFTASFKNICLIVDESRFVVDRNIDTRNSSMCTEPMKDQTESCKQMTSTSASLPLNQVPVSMPVNSNQEALPGGSLSHKESIFLKMHKRISNLELNISLSSEYLSELSRRYVVQTNLTRKQMENTMKSSEEIARRISHATQTILNKKILELSRQIKNLTNALNSMSLQYESIRTSVEDGVLKNNLASHTPPICKDTMKEELSSACLKMHHFGSGHYVVTKTQGAFVIIVSITSTVLLLLAFRILFGHIRRLNLSEKIIKELVVKHLADLNLKNYAISNKVSSNGYYHCTINKELYEYEGSLEVAEDIVLKRNNKCKLQSPRAHSSIDHAPWLRIGVDNKDSKLSCSCAMNKDYPSMRGRILLRSNRLPFSGFETC